MYLAIKHIHLTAVGLSLLLFAIRAFIVIGLKAPIKPKWLKITPHVVDTLLLASAVTLCVLSSQYPFMTAWLTAKVVGLLIYIGAGVVALKGQTQTIRLVAFAVAAAAAAYIISVAFSRSPMPW
ncbi:MAG: SirB2 family protein [Pontibacterium sp.]